MPSQFHRQLADLSYDLAEAMQKNDKSTPEEIGQQVESFLLRHQTEIRNIDRLALNNLGAQLRLLGLHTDANVYQIIEKLHRRVGHGPLGSSHRPYFDTPKREPTVDFKRLNLEGCTDVTDEALDMLARWPDWTALERLNLHLCAEITDKGLSSLAHSTQLTHLVDLNIGGCLLVTDRGVANLAHSLREWHSLDLSHLDLLTDASLGFIAHSEMCRGLQRLRLFGSKKLTDQGLHILSTSPLLDSLVELDLGGGLFHLTEQGIVHLAEMRSLETLSLSECSGVTDKALIKLATLSRLKRLDLTDCPGVSLEGLQPVAHLELIGS